jgi:hypothetical protein
MVIKLTYIALTHGFNQGVLVHEGAKNPTSHRKGSTLNYAGQSIRFLISERSLYLKKASFLGTFKSKHFLSCALIVV